MAYSGEKWKIGIGLHTEATVPAEAYFNHLMHMLGWVKSLSLQGIDFAFASIARAKVAAARRVVVTALLKAECTHWFSVDSDHMLSPELLPKLVDVAKSRKAGMVSGLICKRIFPFVPVAFRKKQTLALEPNMGVVEVDTCAFGCTLIDLTVLRQLPQPWFVDTASGRSDIHLCEAFQARGEKIFVDTSTLVGHLSEPLVVWPGKQVEALRADQMEALLAQEEQA